MFERFTDRARRAMVLAQEEARLLDHDRIGTEHLLLGLAHKDMGVAAKALESLGISLDAVRERVVAITGTGQQTPSGHIPFTQRAKKALELSLRESRELGHHYIGTEHILLGLAREGEGVAAQVLAGLGVDLDRLRSQVLSLHRGHASEGAPSVPPGRIRPGADIPISLEALDQRLAAIERWVGMRPRLDDLDTEIARARRDKESAIDAQDFKTAAALRDREKELVAEKDEREKEWTPGPALAEEIGRLSAELDQLRSMLRGHGTEPDDDGAA